MSPEFLKRIEVSRPAFAGRVLKDTGLTIQAGPFGIDSRPALVLEKAADGLGKGEAFHEQVQNAYWLVGRDISDPGVLAELWKAAGLRPDDLGPALTDSAWSEAVDADVALAQEYGLTGVPALVMDDKYLVVGAQPYAYLKQAIEQVAAA